jgi:hypothetical protein
MEQTPSRLFCYGQDMLHTLFQLRLIPLIAELARFSAEKAEIRL